MSMNMKRILFLLVVAAMCAAFVPTASATTYNFTLRDTSGNAYCDGLYLVLYSSSPGVTPKTLVDGYHWNDNCSGAYASANGFKAGVSSYYQYSGTGAVLIVSDPGYGGSGGGYGYNTLWLVNTTAHHWTGYFGQNGGGEYVFNYGTWINGAVAQSGGTKTAGKR
jgi:hypothetical protein